MYLLVFVTLVIALTGVYAQVLSLQAARLFSHQTTVARALLNWHATAVAQAKTAVNPTPLPGAAGCDLTVNGPVGTLCSGPTGSVTVNGTPTLPNCSGTLTNVCWNSLPPGYQQAPYTFYSVYYQPSPGQSYIITFVPPPAASATNPPPGFITLPGTGAGAVAQIGATMSDLFLQIRNSGFATTSYGTITSVAGVNYLVTSTISNGATATFLQYPIPTGNIIPLGSIAIISTP
ncbi:MAG: hypothetical protein M3N08_08445 [Pseudomonadota bacterium]|nr:hypothetical protein [Pseudomonadota bacterium]